MSKQLPTQRGAVRRLGPEEVEMAIAAIPPDSEWTDGPSPGQWRVKKWGRHGFAHMIDCADETSMNLWPLGTFEGARRVR